jgi:hypothetical protein
LEAVGRSRFAGSLKQRNALWLVYRNFLRQALSNFRAALAVDNRSASLLYYYAMLNFAKAELLTAGATVGGFVSHGLRFNVTRARSIGGDSLTVTDGIFPLLYKARTGRALPTGTRLPIRRLLGHVPEVGTQLDTAFGWRTEVFGLLHLVALDGAAAWTLVAAENIGELESDTATGRYFRRFFRRVEPPPDWRDRFAVSRRAGGLHFYESIAIQAHTPGDEVAVAAAFDSAAGNTWSVRDILGESPAGMWDAWLSPSLYKTRMLPMPPSMARYALAFYASSLVRYRPSMFDSQLSPELAYFLDALTRECAVPMLTDTLAGLTGTDYVFWAEEELRV